MPRILVALCLLFIVLMPTASFSLGLGEIDLRSALNQPFRAAIPVTSEAANDLSGLTVTLASAATFRQFGLDRAPFLQGFKFEVVPQPGGASVQVTSTQPVVEPFVTMLIEVQWAQGRLLREYTVLLDPPVFTERAVQPSVTAPVSGAEPAPSTVTRAPAPRTATPPPARPFTESPPPSFDVGGREVRRNETLWGIAGEMQYLDASLNRNQLMMAIYRANPDAFVGNINRLKAGVILRAPNAAELAQLSRREANAEVARQNESWRGAAPVSDSSARLRLVPPPEGDAAGQRAAGDTAATDVDAQTLRQRIRELESQLSDNQRLIEIRDRELETLQRRLAELQAGQAEAPASDLESELVDEGLPDEGVDAAAPDAMTDEALVDAEALPGELEPDAEFALGDEAAVVDEGFVADEPAPEEAESPPPPAVRPDQVVTTQADDEPSFIGGLLSSIWFYIALALAAVVGLFALRRRQAEPIGWESLGPEEGFSEETHEATTRLRAKTPEKESFVVEEGPASEGTDEISMQPAAAAAAEDVGAAVDVETPFERTISSDVAVNLDQADPVAEAEFHMAYGLYDQAADLLSNALQSEPDRKDYRLKLLEVLFIWENQSGFLDAAKEFQARVDTANDPDWNKVLIMGKQICPDEPLFTGEAAASGDVGELDLAVGDETSLGAVDLNIDEGGTASVDMNLDAADDSLGIDLDTSAPEGDADVLEFDLGGDEGSGESPTVETPTVETDMSDSPTMESPTVESPGVATTMETPTIESPGLGESTMETPTIESPAMSATMETPTIESPAVATTMETPTIETPAVGWDDEEQTQLAPSVDSTAEIELDDLGLDLSELDDAGDEFASDEDSMIIKRDQSLASTGAFDLGGGEIDDSDAIGLLDVDATGERQALASDSDDTAEQPGPEDATSDLLTAGLLDDDADFASGTAGEGEEVTAEMPTSDAQADGPTMTEVGTKLDLARAYIDMGDPDGARSILNEVLEEAGESQRQEAQQLLDDLDG